jgi:hypothetical protein
MRTRPQRLPAALAAGLAATALVSACSSGVPAGAPPSPAPVTAVPPVAAPAAAPGPDAAELDAHRPGDDAFWDTLRLEGAMVVQPPALRTLGTRSTVTVLARVVDVRRSRVLHGTDVIAVVLQPQRVLAGRLRAAGPLRVETLSLGPTPTARRVAALRAALPKGLSVWYLRWQGTPPATTKPGAPPLQLPTDPDLYGLTHPFAVVTQGRSSAATPLAEADAPAVGFVREVRAQRTLSGFLRRFS